MSAYKSTVIQTVHYVEMPYVVARAESEQFEKKAGSWLGLAVSAHVFDFKNVEKIDNSFSDNFQKFKNAAQAKNCSVISVNFRPNVLEGLKRRSQEKVFGYVAGFENARPQIKDSKSEVRTWIVKYIVAASREAMNVMFNTTVAADENYRENVKAFRPEHFYRVSKLVAECTTVRAEFRIYFEKDTLKTLAALSLKMNPTLIDDEIVDSCATELLNLIYGGAKSKINDDRGYDMPPAIPVLISPRLAAETHSSDPKNVAVIPFVTPVGTYYVQIDFGV